MSENIHSSSKNSSPASVPGSSNLRTNSYVLVLAVTAGIVLFGTLFAVVADRVASLSGLETQESVVSGAEPAFDGQFADIDPAVGPEIAPVPTSIAETPLPLDPVVTTVPAPDQTPPPTTQSPLVVNGSFDVTDASGRVLQVDLPSGWRDAGGGIATFDGTPQMSVVITSRRSGHERAVSDYVDNLDGDLGDATFSTMRSFSNSSYVAVGYMTYDGVEITPDSGPRKIFGFVWAGTNTAGTTWIVDWWSDTEASRTTISTYLNFFAERYLPTFTKN